MKAPLIDVHAHFVTDDYYLAAARRAGHHHPDGMPAWPSWDARSHLELMDRHRIARSILSISSPGVHFGDDTAACLLARNVNEFGAGVAREHRGRFGLFAALPLPDVGGALAEIGHAFDELGADGVILLTHYGDKYLSDPAFEPVLAALDDRAAVVLIHPITPTCLPTLGCEPPPPVLEFVFETTRTVVDLLLGGSVQRHPNLRLVVPHGGAALPLLAERISAFRARVPPSDGCSGPDAPIQKQLRELWYDTAGTPFPSQIPALSRLLGVDHVVYGSDYCWTPAPGLDAQIDAIDRAPPPAPNETWRNLTTRNAHALLRDNARATPHL